MVWAQAPAPAKPAEPSSTGSFVLIAPLLIFLVVVFFMMKKAGKMQPKMDRSLDLAEETVALAREQIAVQTETNRLLARMIEVLPRD
jgi:uncharacterized protein YoxC